MRIIPLILLTLLTGCGTQQEGEPAAVTVKAINPLIHADVPDPSIIRRGDTYYMSSTTMHMNPGIPVMKSTDLINWEIVSYVYDELTRKEDMTLTAGKNAYGRGSWASSLRYHNGKYYLATFSNNTGKTHIFSTDDIEKNNWERIDFSPLFHDCSLFFSDDNKAYLVHGSGDIRLTELNEDLTGVKEGGFNDVIIPDASLVAGDNVGLKAEGSHIYQINGYYYVFLITWPKNGIRTQLVFRSQNLTGPYEGRVALSDRGIAQGGIIDTPDGDWYGFLFRDSGAVGRIPWLVPVHWENNWPVFGTNGQAPDTLGINVSSQHLDGIVASDEFEYSSKHDRLANVWQWNHNPDSAYWSLDDRPGFLRIFNGRIDSVMTQARNTLTQRTFGPACEGTVRLDVSGLKEGDLAGLCALQSKYGLIGVKIEKDRNAIVLRTSDGQDLTEVKLADTDKNLIYLRITMDFANLGDTARFYFSEDGTDWIDSGHALHMAYTLPHFMGYRFGLFSFATQTTGGYADFDWFRINSSVTP